MKREGKIAFVLRSNASWMNGYYGLPSGKVEKNESYVEAAIREAKEEVGVTLKTDDLQHIITIHRYESSSQAADWVDVYFEAKDWQGEPYNAEPHVHSQLAWLDPAKLPKNVIPSVSFAISEIKAGKTYSEYGWNKIS